MAKSREQEKRTRRGDPAARPRRAARGITLVEVLVVLAILLLGMLAIARLFPEGFASLSFSGNATTAQALIKAREDELRGRKENLPDGIVPVDPGTGAILSDLDPRTLLTSLRPFVIPGFTGTQPEDPRFTGANIVRRVMGEQFLIPPSTTFGPTGERVSLYRALFSPIYATQAMAPAALGVAAFSGTPMRRVVFSDPPTPQNWANLADLGVFGYGISYENARLYFFSVNYPRVFRIEYTFRAAGGGPSQTVPDNCILLPPSAASPPTQIVFDLRTAQVQMGCTYVPIPPGAELDQGSDFLHRRFQEIAVTQPFDPVNPYEFKVYDTVFGLFGFNPIAASFPLPQREGRGLTARIDYDVDDWQILRQDEGVSVRPVDPDGMPNTGDETYVIKLATTRIKQLGETEETINFVSGQPATTNTFEYQGLVRFYPDNPSRTGTPGVDLVLVDMETGYQIDARTLQAGGNNSNGQIDYGAGVLHLWRFLNRNPGSGPPVWTPPYALQGAAPPVALDPAGRRLRIYYRTYNDFAVASLKPYTRYFMQPNLAQLGYREFTPGAGGYLLFPTLDAEKTVAVDYTWVSQSGQALRSQVGELHQVAPPGTAFAPDPTASQNRWWIRVARADPDPTKGAGDPNADADVVPGSIRITGVRGASFHTRVSWQEGSRQRHRERSTILTREVTR